MIATPYFDSPACWQWYQNLFSINKNWTAFRLLANFCMYVGLTFVPKLTFLFYFCEQLLIFQKKNYKNYFMWLHNIWCTSVRMWNQSTKRVRSSKINVEENLLCSNWLLSVLKYKCNCASLHCLNQPAVVLLLLRRELPHRVEDRSYFQLFQTDETTFNSCWYCYHLTLREKTAVINYL